MAVTIIAQLVVQVVGAPGGDPTDVEADSTAAPQGVVNVVIPGLGSLLAIEPIPAAVEALLANGPATLTITQGGGSIELTTTY